VLGFVTFIPLIGPKRFLQRGKPETDVLSWTMIRSVFGQTIFIVGFQVIQQVSGGAASRPRATPGDW
jgi:hypothetical protein